MKRETHRQPDTIVAETGAWLKRSSVGVEGMSPNCQKDAIRISAACPERGLKETWRDWHYTDAAGFHGIFRSGRLWATITDYPNDASEMRYARHLILQGVNSVRSRVVNRCEWIGSNVTRPVFVTSLSAEKNELSRWCAYGRSSGSFALGFNSERLDAAVQNNNPTR